MIINIQHIIDNLHILHTDSELNIQTIKKIINIVMSKNLWKIWNEYIQYDDENKKNK